MDREHRNEAKKDTGGKRKVVLGVDISTTCTAVSVLDYKTGETVKVYHTVMNNKKKFPHFWSKVEHMEELFNIENDPSWDVCGVAVEESAKRFAPGLSSASTIIMLAKFNGIMCYLLYKKYGLVPKEINVRTGRSQIGLKINTKDKSKTTKQKVLDHVKAINPDFPLVMRALKGEMVEVKINEDRADAWVMAEAARRMFPTL